MSRGVQRARVDGNHGAVVEALKAVGCSVLSLAAVGRGAPDLLVGFRGHNIAFECKDGRKPPSARKLTPDEEQFRLTWRGQYTVITTVAEALAAVDELTGAEERKAG